MNDKAGGFLSSHIRTPAALRPDGQLRQKPVILPDAFRGVFDYSPNCGWHDCNDRYLVRRQQTADLIDSYLLLFTVSGEGMAQVSGKTHRLTHGTVALLPRQTPHSYWVPRGGRWEFYWIHLSGPHCQALLDYLLRQHGCFFEISCPEQAGEVIELLLETPYQYYEYELFASQVISRLLFSLLDSISSPARKHPHRKQQVLEMIDFMESHLNEPFLLRDLSANLYLSTEHMIRIFRDETGMTPHQYLKLLRMRRSCALLEESHASISEIASAVGYLSVSAFIAQFKSVYGMTPRAYRLSAVKPAFPTTDLSFQEDLHEHDNQRTFPADVSAQRG